MKISHVGIATQGGLPFTLAAAICTAVGQQASFTKFNRLAKRTTTQGEADVAGAGDVAVGVFVDVAPRGNSCTVETEGFEWVESDDLKAVGDIVTGGADGKLVDLPAFAGGTATLAELTALAASQKAGIWQVDDVKTEGAKYFALIRLDSRL